MQFNSLEFAIFFPIVTTLYYLLPPIHRNKFLLVASCFFYIVYKPVYILILLSIIILDYITGRLIEQSSGHKRKFFLGVSLCANIGVLFIFKYFNFIFEAILHLTQQQTILSLTEIALPLGLSFHTFQAMAYTIEVYRKNVPAERNIFIYALYVLFYPQLVAGPIERPKHLIPQFKQFHFFDETQISQGLRLMLIGFFKKLFIADRLGVIVNHVFSQPWNYTGIPLLLAIYSFTLQIYYDFSGYTDIARGAAKCLGFDLRNNFNHPFFAQTPADFWSKWHISLSTWFRDYVYIPLGGNKGSMLRWALVIFTVFVLSGLWHGAGWTFVAWGFCHALFIILYKFAQKPAEKIDRLFSRKHIGILTKLIKICFTFHLVALAFVFFRANSIFDGVYIITHINPGISILRTQIFTFSNVFDQIGLGAYQFFLGIIAVAIIETTEVLIHTKKIPSFMIQNLAVRWVFYYIMIFMILFLGDFKANKFIYFQF